MEGVGVAGEEEPGDEESEGYGPEVFFWFCGFEDCENDGGEKDEADRAEFEEDFDVFVLDDFEGLVFVWVAIVHSSTGSADTGSEKYDRRR